MREPRCVSLREVFGRTYRVTYDASYSQKHVPHSRRDPWMMEIPTRCGTVYPYEGTLLVVEVEGHPKLKATLARLDCCRLHQDGDAFGSFIVDVSDFRHVSGIIRPYRRRRFSDKDRVAARERMLALRLSLQ